LTETTQFKHADLVAGLFAIQSEFRYEIVRKLFEGGMGVVYEAEQNGARGFVKRVAIKVIRPAFANQKAFIDNFIGEAKLVADLIHTNIVQTYHLGEADGLCFIAMELIRGANLDQFTRSLTAENRVLPVELAVFIVSRVARGLAYAHAKTDREGHSLGVVHRDVSLKNILIAYEGDVKLTDFGIAKARGLLESNEGQTIAGKAEYMSPEQAGFKVTDCRSDIFSAGIVLAHLLLGYNIFKGATSKESLQLVTKKPIPDFAQIDPRIDSRLNGILHRALARKLEERYQTADELLYDLEFQIYRSGYGPTNETLGKFMRELFGKFDPKAFYEPRGSTRLLEQTARVATRGSSKNNS